MQNSQPWMIQLLPAKKPRHKTPTMLSYWYGKWWFMSKHSISNSSNPKQIINIHYAAKQAHSMLLKQTKALYHVDDELPQATRIDPARKRDPDCDRLVWNAQRFSFCPIWTQPGVKAWAERLKGWKKQQKPSSLLVAMLGIDVVSWIWGWRWSCDIAWCNRIQTRKTNIHRLYPCAFGCTARQTLSVCLLTPKALKHT